MFSVFVGKDNVNRAKYKIKAQKLLFLFKFMGDKGDKGVKGVKTNV